MTREQHLPPVAKATRMLHGQRCSADDPCGPAGGRAARQCRQRPRQAGTYQRVASAPPEDRITKSDWFVRKHRGIGPAVWRHASVKRATNCAACHTGANRGQFSDGDLRLPPGLDPKLTRGWKD